MSVGSKAEAVRVATERVVLSETEVLELEDLTRELKKALRLRVAWPYAFLVILLMIVLGCFSLPRSFVSFSLQSMVLGSLGHIGYRYLIIKAKQCQALRSELKKVEQEVSTRKYVLVSANYELNQAIELFKLPKKEFRKWGLSQMKESKLHVQDYSSDVLTLGYHELCTRQGSILDPQEWNEYFTYDVYHEVSLPKRYPKKMNTYRNRLWDTTSSSS